MREMANK